MAKSQTGQTLRMQESRRTHVSGDMSRRGCIRGQRDGRKPGGGECRDHVRQSKKMWVENSPRMKPRIVEGKGGPITLENYLCRGNSSKGRARSYLENN